MATLHNLAPSLFIPLLCFIFLISTCHHLAFLFVCMLSFLPGTESMAFVLSVFFLFILTGRRKTETSSFLSLIISPGVCMQPSFTLKSTKGWVGRWDMGRHRMKLTEEWQLNTWNMKKKRLGSTQLLGREVKYKELKSKYFLWEPRVTR